MANAPMLRKPLIGGVFGQVGEFELATQVTVASGLHSLRVLVIQPRAGRVLAIADTKTDALASARRVLRSTVAANDEPQWVQPLLWSDTDLSVVSCEPPPRAVSKRRRGIFLRSGGCCHYCGTPLRLDGEWHIEHQLSKALGGNDDAINLVASCTPCNLRKGPLSALEFIAA